ncbi:MAG: alpha/beta hydrolase [Promethearchaeota archaeon]|nr:MAG: alpha/beta hydrolase [Candidatus Lokiarchaeota archaeon]
MNNHNSIFIHGLESSGHGFKGNYFRKYIPGILTPDLEPYMPNIAYQKLLEIRMGELNEILDQKENWNIIGSSFGGLMGALYSLKNPKNVRKLILLAPMLAVPELNPSKFNTINIPVVVYHGKNDDVISITPTKKRAGKLFSNLIYNIVDDDHMLHPTTESIKWAKLLDLKDKD